MLRSWIICLPVSRIPEFGGTDYLKKIKFAEIKNPTLPSGLKII